MPTPEISVQLYSIHEALDADLDGSLGPHRRDRPDGPSRPSTSSAGPTRCKESFDRYGLSSPTAHAILIEDEGVATPDGLLRCRRPRRPSPPPSCSACKVVIDPFVRRAAGAPSRTCSATPTGSTTGAAQAAELRAEGRLPQPRPRVRAADRRPSGPRGVRRPARSVRPAGGRPLLGHRRRGGSRRAAPAPRGPGLRRARQGRPDAARHHRARAADATSSRPARATFRSPRRFRRPRHRRTPSSSSTTTRATSSTASRELRIPQLDPVRPPAGRVVRLAAPQQGRRWREQPSHVPGTLIVFRRVRPQGSRR